MTTIDKATKLNLGMTVALLAMTATGAFFLSNLQGSLGSMEGSLREVKQALDRNTQQIVGGSRDRAVIDSRVIALERRVLELEREK